MKIVYAPTLIPESRNYLFDNIVQGFDIQVLETLCDILDEAPEFGGGGFFISHLMTKKLSNLLLLH